VTWVREDISKDPAYPVRDFRIWAVQGGSEILVLASGGLDSSTLLTLLRQAADRCRALFVHYGQAAAEAEQSALARICTTLRVPLQVVRYEGSRFGGGEIPGRNAFLLQIALLEFGGASGVVATGIHAGVPYRDCSPEFVELMERSYAFHTGGAITVCAPFIDWTKADIFALAVSIGVPINDTYSCEAGNTPCGNCASCLDRAALGAEGPYDRA
jgi:7-cyano-7-deazaguanine synthase